MLKFEFKYRCIIIYRIKVPGGRASCLVNHSVNNNSPVYLYYIRRTRPKRNLLIHIGTCRQTLRNIKQYKNKIIIIIIISRLRRREDLGQWVSGAIAPSWIIVEISSAASWSPCVVYEWPMIVERCRGYTYNNIKPV